LKERYFGGFGAPGVDCSTEPAVPGPPWVCTLPPMPRIWHVYESNQPKERYQASQLIESLIPPDMHEARELEPQPALAGLSQSVS